MTRTILLVNVQKINSSGETAKIKIVNEVDIERAKLIAEQAKLKIEQEKNALAIQQVLESMKHIQLKDPEAIAPLIKSLKK